MSRFLSIIIAIAIILAIVIVGYIFRANVKSICKKVWNYLAAGKRRICARNK